MAKQPEQILEEQQKNVNQKDIG